MEADPRVSNSHIGVPIVITPLPRDGSRARRCTKRVCADNCAVWLYDTDLVQIHSTDLEISVSIERLNRVI